MPPSPPYFSLCVTEATHTKTRLPRYSGPHCCVDRTKIITDLSPSSFFLSLALSPSEVPLSSVVRNYLHWRRWLFETALVRVRDLVQDTRLRGWRDGGRLLRRWGRLKTYFVVSGGTLLLFVFRLQCVSVYMVGEPPKDENSQLFRRLEKAIKTLG